MEKTLKKPVSEFMTKKVISVRKDETIKHLFQLMNEHGILGAPVVDAEGKVVGIVTETDLIRHLTTLKTPRGIHILGSILYLDDIQDFNKQLKEHCAETIEAMMQSPVVTLKTGDTLLDALNRMSEKNISRLPVVDQKGRLEGLITRSDVVRELARIKTL